MFASKRKLYGGRSSSMISDKQCWTNLCGLASPTSIEEAEGHGRGRAAPLSALFVATDRRQIYKYSCHEPPSSLSDDMWLLWNRALDPSSTEVCPSSGDSLRR